MYEFKTQRTVEFADTDMEGIVHFARFLIYMETAEHQFLEALGTRVATEIDGKKIGWPRVSVACEYQSPARFGDVLDIHVKVLRKGSKSMTYGFEFQREGQAIARGKVTSVCCELGREGGIRGIEIPTVIADKIEEAPR